MLGSNDDQGLVIKTFFLKFIDKRADGSVDELDFAKEGFR
jgi:hypothetical protein